MHGLKWPINSTRIVLVVRLDFFVACRLLPLREDRRECARKRERGVCLPLIRHVKTCTTDIYLHNECAHVGLSIDAPRAGTTRGSTHAVQDAAGWQNLQARAYAVHARERAQTHASFPRHKLVPPPALLLLRRLYHWARPVAGQ